MFFGEHAVPSSLTVFAFSISCSQIALLSFTSQKTTYKPHLSPDLHHDLPSANLDIALVLRRASFSGYKQQSQRRSTKVINNKQQPQDDRPPFCSAFNSTIFDHDENKASCIPNDDSSIFAPLGETYAATRSKAYSIGNTAAICTNKSDHEEKLPVGAYSMMVYAYNCFQWRHASIC